MPSVLPWLMLFSMTLLYCLLYCIVYRYLYSASHSVSQTEALSVHFSSRKKVRLTVRERINEHKGGGRRFQSDKLSSFLLSMPCTKKLGFLSPLDTSARVFCTSLVKKASPAIFKVAWSRFRSLSIRSAIMLFSKGMHHSSINSLSFILIC